MKVAAIFAFVSFLGYHTCTQKDMAMEAATPGLFAADSTELTVDFKKDIQPILQTRCTPCHFPGGKMYSKMPFDEPKTITDLKERMFTRIKEPEEVKKLKAFLGQVK